MTRPEWTKGMCMDCRTSPAAPNALFCTPCEFRELEVEGPTYRVSDPLLTTAEDPWYIGGNHLPAKQQRPDPTRQDRAAA